MQAVQPGSRSEPLYAGWEGGLSPAGAGFLLTKLVTFILSTGNPQPGPADATSSRKPPALRGHRTGLCILASSCRHTVPRLGEHLWAWPS